MCCYSASRNRSDLKEVVGMNTQSGKAVFVVKTEEALPALDSLARLVAVLNARRAAAIKGHDSDGLAKLEEPLRAAHDLRVKVLLLAELLQQLDDTLERELGQDVRG